MDIKVLLNKKIKASVTVEAALSFTLMVFILFAMLGPLLIIKTTSDLLIDMNDVSMARAEYEAIKYHTQDTEIYNKLEEYISGNDFLKENFRRIENITNYGILLARYINNYDDSKREYRNVRNIYDINNNVYDEETGVVRLDYEVNFDIPYNVLNISGIDKRLLITRRAFIGSDGDRFDQLTNSGDYIYLAENYVNSRKYHTYIDCTYLKKIVYSYRYYEIPTLKNENNKLYSKCSYCFKDINITNDTTCYITQYGDLFHHNENCPLMTAYVTKRDKTFAEENNLILCDRCERRGNIE